MKTKAECIATVHSYFEGTARKQGVTKMAIFGSVARGDQQEFSDVDIAYEGEPNLFVRIRMKMELEQLLGCKVDLIRLRSDLDGSSFAKHLSNDLIYV